MYKRRGRTVDRIESWSLWGLLLMVFLAPSWGKGIPLKQKLEQGSYSELLKDINLAQKNRVDKKNKGDDPLLEYWLWHFKGHALYGLGRITEARKSFGEAIRSPHASAFDYENYASLLLFENHNTEAVAVIASYLRNPAGRNSTRSHISLYGLLHRAMSASLLWADLDTLEFLLDEHIEFSTVNGKLPLVKSSEYHVSSIELRQSLTSAIAAGYPRKQTIPSQKNLLKKISEAPLHLGFISGGLGNHPVGRLISDLVASLNFPAVSVSVFSRSQINESYPWFSNIVKAADVVDIHGVDVQTAAQIVTDAKVDVLFDLDGHTLHGSPAVLSYLKDCIVVEYMGFPGTTSLESVDFIITDHNVVSVETGPKHFSEKIAIVPDTYLVSSIGTLQPHIELLPPASFMEIKNLAYPFVNVQSGEPIVLSILCPLHRITPAAVETWANIMRLAPQTVLWLTFTSTAAATTRLTEQFLARGISAGRVFYDDQTDHVDHVRRRSLVHLFLDCFVRSAHSSTIDTVWAGRPVLTMRGETMDSRGTSTIQRSVFCGSNTWSPLQNACLTEKLYPLDTHSLKEYEVSAVSIGSGRSILPLLREELTSARSAKLSKLYKPLIAAQQFVKVTQLFVESCLLPKRGKSKNSKGLCGYHLVALPGERQ